MLDEDITFIAHYYDYKRIYLNFLHIVDRVLLFYDLYRHCPDTFTARPLVDVVHDRLR